MPGVSLEHLEHLNSWYPLVISITALSLLRKFLRKKQMKSNNLLCNDGDMTIPQIYCVCIYIYIGSSQVLELHTRGWVEGVGC